MNQEMEQRCLKNGRLLVQLLLVIVTLHSCNQNLKKEMNTTQENVKEIASWQCPDQYIPTDALVNENQELLLFNSSNYYYNMKVGTAEMAQVPSSKELVRAENTDLKVFLVTTYEDKSYNCYRTPSLSMDGAEKIELGADLLQMAYNEATDAIWYVATSQELYAYNMKDESTQKLSDEAATSVFLSDNNQYVAFEGKESVVWVAATNAVDKAVKHDLPEGTDLVGITNDGQLVLVELSLAQKNSAEASSRLLLKSEEGTTVLVADSDYNWAILQGNYVVTSNSKGVISLLELL